MKKIRFLFLILSLISVILHPAHSREYYKTIDGYFKNYRNSKVLEILNLLNEASFGPNNFYNKDVRYIYKKNDIENLFLYKEPILQYENENIKIYQLGSQRYVIRHISHAPSNQFVCGISSNICSVEFLFNDKNYIVVFSVDILGSVLEIIRREGENNE